MASLCLLEVVGGRSNSLPRIVSARKIDSGRGRTSDGYHTSQSRCGPLRRFVTDFWSRVVRGRNFDLHRRYFLTNRLVAIFVDNNAVLIALVKRTSESISARLFVASSCVWVVGGGAVSILPISVSLGRSDSYMSCADGPSSL